MKKESNFFVLEGLDGSGTTTQLKRLTAAATDLTPSLYPTFEPTDNPIGLLIRRILHGKLEVPPDTLMRLFSADRSLHLYQPRTGILERLDRGELVLSDRYLFSSVAYQALGSPFEDVLTLNPFPLPQKVFFIELSPELCAARRQERSMEELFDDLETQRAIRDNYYRVFDAFPNLEVEIIDGTCSEEEITRSIWRSLPYPPILDM